MKWRSNYSQKNKFEQAIEKYNSDSLRYHLIANGPEKKDTNFTIQDFEATHNSEIVNKFGNLVNRTLKFKGLEELPIGQIDEDIKQEIIKTYENVGSLIEKLEFREAVRKIVELVEKANKFYDDKQPWVAKKENIEEFNNIIYTCAVVIVNLSNLFEPIMPNACAKIREFLEIESPSWEYIEPKANLKLDKVEPLFSRI